MLTSLASRSMPILLFFTLSCAISMQSVAVSQTTKERGIAPPSSQDSRPISQKEADAEAKRLLELAIKMYQQGKTIEGTELIDRALMLSETASGLDRATYVKALMDAALFRQAKGEFSAAEQRHRRALEIAEKEFGPNHLLTAAVLNGYGLFYSDLGDLIHAEQSFQRSVDIREKALGPNNYLVGVSLANLASVFNERGDYDTTERLFLRALSIIEKQTGMEDSTSMLLNNLGGLYLNKRDDARAEQYFQRSLKIQEKVFGAQAFELGLTLNNLATVYSLRGDDERAELMYRRVVEIYEKTREPNFIGFAAPLANLAAIYWKRRDFARAEPLLRRAFDLTKSYFGEKHDKMANMYYFFARMYEAKGDVGRAIAAQESTNNISEQNLSYLLSAGSEKQKRQYAAMRREQNNVTISLHVRSAPDNAEAARLALTSILRLKGRTLDVTTEQIGALRRRLTPQDRVLFDQLSEARARLAAAVFKGVGQTEPAVYRERVAQLEEEAEHLEAQISARSAEFRVQTQTINLSQVQSAVPDGAALVELVMYRPYIAQAKTLKEREGVARYVAYVLWHQGDPTFVDLGEAAPIDSAVARLRVALGKRQSTDFKQAGRALDELVMRPVRKLLGGTRMLLLSPDGALNLVPFGALVDEDGHYLVENYTIDYLTSGRDLLRLTAETESRQQPIVIANPDFDLAVTASSQEAPEADAARGLRSLDFKTLQIDSLPGTAQEATAIKGIFPNAQVLTERAATESALKQVKGPRLLHIATHGFFLKDQLSQESGTARQLVMGEAPRAVQGENPLLRSGLVLAGVKNGQSGAGEDGVLTALEVSGLDLWGTKLVVLSACETGVGDVANGEGVYGLRRALVLAGAESQLMSLWQVSDTATRDLMVDYYRRIERGEGRTEALRAAQLGMVAWKKQGAVRQKSGAQANSFSVDYSHPYYWASFIPIGDWRNMNKTVQPLVVAPPQPVTLSKQPAAPPRPAIAPKPTEKQSDIEALTRMGDTRYAQGDFAGAAALYKRSLALRPGNADLLVKLGDTYLHQSTPDYEGAIAEYRRALMRNSRHEKAWSGIAAAAIGLKRVLTARDAINKLAEINPSNSELATLRAALAALQ